MGTIAEKLNYLNQTKEDIKQAIIGKGVEITNSDTFRSYASKISEIQTDGGEPVQMYRVRVIGYDGTIVDSVELKSGDTYTLPEFPSSLTKGTFIPQKYFSAEFGNKQPGETINIGVENVDFGVAYTRSSSSPYWEFDIEVTPVTGLSITLNITGSKNWGDGSSDTTKSHTYSSYGKYTIKCENGTMDSLSSSAGLFGQTSTVAGANYTLKEARIYAGTIGRYAFQTCYSLRRCLIAVTSISSYAFSGCRALENILLPDVEYLDSSVLSDCQALKICVLSKNSQMVNGTCFQSCYSLTDIILPHGEDFSIPASCFASCYNLKNMVIPGNVKEIQNYAFNYCAGLISVKLLDGVGVIRDSCFANCTSLETVDFPSSITDITSNAFNYCYSLKNIEFKEGLLTLSSNTFEGCYSLEEITIPSTVELLGAYVFATCSRLTKVTIKEGSSLTVLGNYLFSYDTGLKEIAIPKNITTINQRVFSNCSNITKYDFRTATAIPTLGNSNAFTNINKTAKIVVPDSLYSSWKTATNWSTYANYIYKASEVPV